MKYVNRVLIALILIFLIIPIVVFTFVAGALGGEFDEDKPSDVLKRIFNGLDY